MTEKFKGDMRSPEKKGNSREDLFNIARRAVEKVFSGSVAFVESMSKGEGSTKEAVQKRKTAGYAKNDLWAPILDRLTESADQADAEGTVNSLREASKKLREQASENRKEAETALSVGELDEDDTTTTRKEDLLGHAEDNEESADFLDSLVQEIEQAK